MKIAYFVLESFCNSLTCYNIKPVLIKSHSRSAYKREPKTTDLVLQLCSDDQGDIFAKISWGFDALGGKIGSELHFFSLHKMGAGINSSNWCGISIKKL